MADDFVSVEDHLTASEMKIYPNPFTQATSIRFDLTQTEDVYFELYNMLGQKVYVSETIEYEVGQHNRTITPGSLEQGIYFLQAHFGRNTITKKVTINQ